MIALHVFLWLKVISSFRQDQGHAVTGREPQPRQFACTVSTTFYSLPWTLPSMMSSPYLGRTIFAKIHCVKMLLTCKLRSLVWVSLSLTITYCNYSTYITFYFIRLTIYVYRNYKLLKRFFDDQWIYYLMHNPFMYYTLSETSRKQCLVN